MTTHAAIKAEAIYKLNPQGIFTYVNQGFVDFFQTRRENLLGRHYSELVHPLHREEVQQFYARQLQEQQHNTYLEFPVVPVNKVTRWVGQTVELVTAGDQIVELLGVAQDLTAQRRAQRDLARAELRMEALVKHINAAILVEDEYRSIMFVNENFCRLFDIPAPPEALQGADCSQSAEQAKHFFDDPEMFIKRVGDILKERKAVYNEQLQFADGRILERDYVPIFYQEQFAGQMWQYRDITEKAQTERRIRESEEKYRRIIENINLGLLQVDLDQKIVYANRSFQQLVGYSEQELQGQRADQLLLFAESEPEYVEQVGKVNQERAKGESGAYEMKVRHKNGQALWFIISGTPLYDTEGQVIGSMGIHSDITALKEREIERKELLKRLHAQNENLQKQKEELSDALEQKSQAQQALRQNEQRLEKILMSALDGVITVNAQGQVDMWNSMAEEIFGYSAAQALGQNLAPLIFPADSQLAQKGFGKKGLEPYLNQRVETYGRDKQGRQVPLEMSVTPVQSSQGKTFTAFFRDISQRKQSEAELQNALNTQKNLGRLRSRLIAMTSHELRTPLTTIKTNLELLRLYVEKPESQPAAKALRQMERMDLQIERLQDIMNNIMLVGKEGAGQMEYKPLSTDLVSYCQQFLAADYQPAEDGRSVRLEVLGSPRLLRMDPNLMHYVLTNLLGNALKYSPEAAPPILQLRYETEEVVMAIQDFGIGIPADEQDQVFTAFYRAENSSSFQGTGMGLAIARQFIEMHGGRLTLHSQPGEGSTFYITLSYH